MSNPPAFHEPFVTHHLFVLLPVAMEPRMELIGEHWAGPLRQVLDQTAEFKEDSGIYDALGCQAGHVLATCWPRVGHVFRCAMEDYSGGFPPAAQLRKRRSGPLSPCFVWDGLFAHLGLDCGSLWIVVEKNMALLWRFLYVFVGNLGKYALNCTEQATASCCTL